MVYPIVKVTTEDALVLHGLFSEVKNTDTILIHVHGTAGNFYENPFIEPLSKQLTELNVSFLSTNNRGMGVLQYGPATGAATEKFEECLTDIQAWIAFALGKGYKKIILQGHSFGTEKVVYYMNKGRYTDKIIGVILLGFADSFGGEQSYLKRKSLNLMKEAEELVRNSKGYQFLLGDWLSNCGELPISASSFLNFFGEGSELSKALPFRKAKALLMLRNIKVPILGIIGDKNEYTEIPISDAITLMERENPLCRCYQIKDSPHNFEGKEKEMTEIIRTFLKTVQSDK